MSISRLLTAAAILAAAVCMSSCGDSPTMPTLTPPPARGSASPSNAVATLSVVIVGHIKNGPIVGVAVRLEPVNAVGTADLLEQQTDADGQVRWHVVPNQRYTVHVRNQVAIIDELLIGSAQWLVSLPE